jgi:ubiquinone/menaquinone biosynthesis C-methylase UbiE
MLQLQPKSYVLDVGSGTGALTNAVAKFAAHVVGLDTSRANLAVAGKAAADLGLDNVSYVVGDFRDPCLQGGYDMAVARFLFQHLADPVGDAVLISRLVRPGGRVGVIDIDDGANIMYPEPPAALTRLYRAHAEGQACIGGDRFVGRKLYHYLSAAGLANVSVRPLTQCFVTPPVRGIVAQSVAHFILHFSSIRDHLVGGARTITASEFDEAIEAGIAYIGQSGNIQHSELFIAAGTRRTVS